MPDNNLWLDYGVFNSPRARHFWVKNIKTQNGRARGLGDRLGKHR